MEHKAWLATGCVAVSLWLANGVAAQAASDESSGGDATQPQQGETNQGKQGDSGGGEEPPPPPPEESGAGGKPDDKAGQYHFRAGAHYYEAGDYEDALSEFQRAYEVSQRAELFYNISLTHEKLANYEKAAKFLKRYLEQVEKIPNRNILERRLANLRERAKKQRKQERQEQSQQDDGEDEDAAEETDSPPPPPDGEETKDEGEAEGEAKGPKRETPEDKKDAADKGPPPGQGGPPADGGGGVPVGASVSFAIGAAGFVTAAVAGGLALKSKSDAESLPCAETNTCEGASVLDEMDTRALVADIGLGIGAAASVVGLIWLVAGSGDGEEAPESTANVELQPWIDVGGGGGARVEGRF